MRIDGLASRFCQLVITSPDMSNATARIGAWMIGAAEATGGFPLELSCKQITEGFVRNGTEVKGTGSRHETVRSAVEWLSEHGYLRVADGSPLRWGRRSQKYTLEV